MSQMTSTQHRPTSRSASVAENLIAMHLESFDELFDPLDPAPPLDRDLHPRAEEFIVASAKEGPPDTPLRLVVRLDRTCWVAGGSSDAVLRNSAFFRAQRSSGEKNAPRALPDR